MPQRYDAVIVGGGHNGLVAATYLARGGLRVLVLERRELLGGACITEELSPGYHLSSCSYICHLLQAGKNRLDDPPRLASMSIPEIIGLPTFPRAYSRGDLAQISELEARGVLVSGFVARIIPMDDGDYHIQITEAPLGRCLDHDTTDQLITELTPGIRGRHPAYTLQALRALCGTDTQIRVSGWLLYDSPHKGDGGRSTPWEVHPVTRIKVCCWREVA